MRLTELVKLVWICDAADVADDQQGRVFERLAVLQQLAVGFVQVGMLALVLPGEVTAVPDVRKAFAAAGLGGAGLEA